jgi:hypothetical protein
MSPVKGFDIIAAYIDARTSELAGLRSPSLPAAGGSRFKALIAER